MKQVADNSRLIIASTIIGDFIILNISFFIIYLLFSLFIPEKISALTLQTHLTILNICYIPSVSIFKVILHNRIVRPEKMIQRLIYSICLYVLFSITILGLLKITFISNLFNFCYYLLFLILLIFWRLSLRAVIKSYRKDGKNSRSAIIIGSGNNMQELYRQISSDSTFGYRIMGVFNDEENNLFSKDAEYLGKVVEIIPYLQEHYVNEVFCGLPSKRQSEILPIIDYCENNMIRFFSVPNVRNYLKRKMKLELIGDIPVLYIRDEPLTKPENRILKRSFDLASSTIFLCSLYPFIYIIIGTLIKLSSPGPIYFKQKRSGRNGEIFECIKFRSMRVNEDSDKLQATKSDPRKTKIGNFLRKSNMDELPQFINVWKGEMSMIGPRPHMLKHTEEYSALINKFMVRHLVKPGITGWAQVNGCRGETKELYQMEERIKKDIWYIENWSFLLDIRIIYMTIRNIIQGEKNAY